MNIREEQPSADRPIPGGPGGSGEGKGANSAPETAPPTKLQTDFQLLTKDFLRFWMVDILQGVAGRNQLPKRDTRRTRWAHLENEAGTTEGIRCTAPGESVVVKLPAA